MIKHLKPRSKWEVRINLFKDFILNIFKFKKSENFSFYPTWEFKFQIGIGSYFNNRVEINTTITQLLCLLIFVPSIFLLGTYSLFLVPFLFFGWGHVFWHLPIYTKYDECDPPEYGYYYYENALWINNWRKIKFILNFIMH